MHTHTVAEPFPAILSLQMICTLFRLCVYCGYARTTASVWSQYLVCKTILNFVFSICWMCKAHCSKSTHTTHYGCQGGIYLCGVVVLSRRRFRRVLQNSGILVAKCSKSKFNRNKLFNNSYRLWSPFVCWQQLKHLEKLEKKNYD